MWLLFYLQNISVYVYYMVNYYELSSIWNNAMKMGWSLWQGNRLTAKGGDTL